MLMLGNTQMIVKCSKDWISSFELHGFFWKKKKRVLAFALTVQKELGSKLVSKTVGTDQRHGPKLY